ncbi:hypothetical protein IMY05_C1869000100 [Salix suchowensis]|nr:hypothetical protein IMY05_C1869000100 [Salix suchowensis]
MDRNCGRQGWKEKTADQRRAGRPRINWRSKKDTGTSQPQAISTVCTYSSSSAAWCSHYGIHRILHHCRERRQGQREFERALIWLGVEIALSLLRMLIWSLNPLFDEHTDLTFKLELEANNPCQHVINSANGVIPLARSHEFLGQITSFVGLLEPFESVGDGVALYYTMSALRETTTKRQRNRGARQHDNVKSDSEDNVGRLCARLRGKVSMASNHITNNKPFVKKLDEHCASIFRKLNKRATDPTRHTEIKRTWALTEPRKEPETKRESDSPPSVDELAYLRVGSSSGLNGTSAQAGGRGWMRASLS